MVSIFEHRDSRNKKKKRNKRSAPPIFVYACNYSNILYCAPIRQKSNPRNNRKIIHHDKLRRATSHPVATCSDVDSCEYKVLHIFDIVQHSVITINAHDTLPLCWHGNSICLRKFYIVDLGYCMSISSMYQMSHSLYLMFGGLDMPLKIIVR